MARKVMDPVERLRALCLALPAVSERDSHGEPCFFVNPTPKSSKLFVMLDQHHHGGEQLGFWCAAPLGAQEELIGRDPQRFYRPPYVGHRGWLGVRLDAPDGVGPDWSLDWDEIEEIVCDAYRQVAPARLIATMESANQ